MGWSAGHYPEQMKKWWMCSKGKFCKEYMALLRTDTSGGAEPELSVVIRIASLRWAGHVARMDENFFLI
jgi:hypothetical protein